MTFLEELRRELAAHGVRGRRARRIELELADHLACEPDAALGEPAAIAERFAVELRTVLTRRASIGTFGALAFCAGALLAASVSLSLAGGYPVRTGLLVALSGLGVAGFAQVALVAGVLALVRGVRGEAAGDLRLAQRRALVALAAGSVVAVSLAVHGLAVQPMPLWWHALTVAAALATLPALAAAAWAAHGAVVLTPAAPAEGFGADLPPALRRRSPLVLALLGVAAVGAVVLQGIVGEHSLAEGVVRGALEALGLVAAVAVLGRLLGLRRQCGVSKRFT
jgi:hypothetical protein